MEDVRQRMLLRGLDHISVNIYMKSWSDATIKQYNSYLEKWTCYCVERKVHPGIPSLVQVMGFFTWLSLVQDLSYSAVNSARSALSAYLQDYYDNHTVGSHPEITRHIKGIYRNKPTKAKVAITWDVNTVFVLLKRWDPLDSLTLLQLTFKCVTLLALVLAQRAQTISLMCISGLTWLEERVLIAMNELLKHNKVGQPLEVFQISKFNKDRRLCPWRTLKAYIKATKERRGGSDKLWISLSRPYKGVGKDTISRWIRKTLGLAGVDSNVYTAHSTRGASASKAKSIGVPLETILHRARWTNSTTFGRFYDKRIDP